MLLGLLDRREFRDLFVDHLGWSNPDQGELSVEVGDGAHTLTQVAGFKGLRVWFHDGLPSRSIQRQIDQAVGAKNLERLVIFADEHNQAWRWPRRAQMGGANAKLVLHERRVGASDARLVRQLEAIAIGFEEELTLVDLLSRMRRAFDHEAETTATQAARLMSTLYAELEAAGWDQHNSTLLLARLLFLYFADDSGMWKHSGRPDQFQAFLIDDTTDETLADDLSALFQALSHEQRRADLPEVVRAFRYVNGGLFADEFTMGPLTEAFRAELIDAGDFDWSVISPAVFGSMFQTVKTRSDRRGGGEHYTTETNILRTINPLFMDGLRDRLERAWNDRAQLTRLHNELGKIRVLDPACGCGNFLIVAYRELRALELELLLRQRELDLQNKGKDYAQLSFDVTGDLKVRLDHFYGIEIEEWPARIAETAMLLVDHLANQRMAEDFGLAPDRLPIRIASKIHLGSALSTDWNDVVPASELTHIVGNPPFNGSRTMSAAQKAELRAVAHGIREAGFLDYVAGWYLLAARVISENPKIRCALVSTNSVAQGEQPAIIWRTMYSAGMHINFAHQTFEWDNESPDAAAVHCVIIGFSTENSSPKRLFSYARGRGLPVETKTKTIGPYLTDGIEYAVGNRQSQISGATEMFFGNMAADKGNLLLSPDEREALLVESPAAARLILPFYGSREFINGVDRYCLWLDGVPEADWRAFPEIVRRVEATRRIRLDSARPQLAATPHLFAQITQRPTVPFLIVPRTSSERRRYVPMAFFEPGRVASDGCLVVAGATLADFALLTSEMHMDWVRTVGGRLKSDYRYSKDVVYNNFVFPDTLDSNVEDLAGLAQVVLDARADYADRTLAWLYDESTMPRSLRQAHSELDARVEGLYRAKDFTSADERVAFLLELHREREAGLLSRDVGRRRVR
ncbi:class I SAM-dependent DNA methyltransferase [Curtobacterium flaccumfaciens]|uniref:class I SAM-dependent DNA methyltransferase n=1 Tax=Curtobacterium flaccumfaciens TaxID=2035 RepID=UPI001BE05D0D|nr:DNA methyltransferase [Curtobacterium flaccumfaciens]MBT1585765.1 class I SAM-dependent DNA methyltransferase [Curtobacterium flaccumfaciens pv. flaccumfaciens]MCX2797433.1 N-6 DNA methylase [Curtobacterium flaccumfaciens pv. flaccumfaciens]